MQEIFSFILSFASADTLRWVGLGVVVLGSILQTINGLAFRGNITWTRVLAVVFAALVSIVGVLFLFISNAPRNLTSGQQATIANKLRPLALIPEPSGKPERIDIDVFPQIGEAVSLANQIENAVKLAGWERVSPIRSTQPSSGMVVSGVEVLMTAGSEKSRRCAEGLAKALNDAGVKASLGDIPLPPPKEECSNSPKDDPYCSRVLVMVGERP